MRRSIILLLRFILIIRFYLYFQKILLKCRLLFIASGKQELGIEKQELVEGNLSQNLPVLKVLFVHRNVQVKGTVKWESKKLTNLPVLKILFVHRKEKIFLMMPLYLLCSIKININLQTAFMNIWQLTVILVLWINNIHTAAPAQWEKSLPQGFVLVIIKNCFSFKISFFWTG